MFVMSILDSAHAMSCNSAYQKAAISFNLIPSSNLSYKLNHSPPFWGSLCRHYQLEVRIMQRYQKEFIELAIKVEALRFGEFTLKSGRTSPYFFNAGQFSSGAALAALGRFYAEAIEASGIAYDVLFGPAYKGIPLASTTAVALADNFSRDIPYCFNRKEAKDHGEGGVMVGAELKGKVLVIDDVITAGTAIREVMQIIEAAGAECAGVVIGP